ncbi:hypothetical protein ACWD5Q_28670 [Streptomyces sp. NPDC002513]
MRHLARLAEAEAPANLVTWQDWEDWIAQILRLHEQQSEDDACEVAALAGRALDTDKVTRGLVGRTYEVWAATLRDQLGTMQDAGLLRSRRRQSTRGLNEIARKLHFSPRSSA